MVAIVMVTMVSGGICGGSVINDHSWWSFLFYVLFLKSLKEIWKLQLKFQVESWKSKILSFFHAEILNFMFMNPNMRFRACQFINFDFFLNSKFISFISIC